MPESIFLGNIPSEITKSMQEEIQESHTAKKKKEQTLHAKTISKDTYVFWTSEE